MRIGFVVNPIAGLGGRVGLKGTDGPGTVAQALERGAVPQAGPRARRTLKRLSERVPGAGLVVASGQQGTDWAEGLDLDVTVIGLTIGSQTARDTRLVVEAMADCDIIVFAGGDGTARDVAFSLKPGQAMLGIPCGVKMHSGVFAISPEAAGALIAELQTAPERVTWTNEAEVMDIDEAALRQGHIAPELFGHARVPIVRNRMQASKGGPRTDWGAALAGAVAELVGQMDPDTVYIIGPGTSAGAVMRAAGHTPTVLGIDAMRGGEVVARDVGSTELERLAGNGPVRIVLGVTGQQGFLIGRGNQQISPALLRHVGREGLIILAAEDKLMGLAQPRLWVDSGDPELDAELEGFLRVRTARGRETMMRLSAG
ncbi:MAG: ATP-NAD kinase family protein [Hyphomicrobiales bacterium]|jgi:predicted polyphosphate/ATP-dependent NAD kinase